MKTLFYILSFVFFTVAILITGCGDEQVLPVAPNNQAAMAPPNGNANGHDKILAINTASGTIVCVPKVAVGKSPVLEAVDGVIQVDDSLVYVSLTPEALAVDSFFDVFFDVFIDSFFDIFIELGYDDVEFQKETYQRDGCEVPSIVIIIVTGDIDPPTAIKKIVGLLDTMTDVDAYSRYHLQPVIR